MKEKVPDAGEVKDKVAEKTPCTEEVKSKAKQAAGAAQDHPVAVTAGAAAAGLVAGLAIPETDVEREKLGPPAKHLKEQVQSTAQELLDRTKEAAKDPGPPPPTPGA